MYTYRGSLRPCPARFSRAGNANRSPEGALANRREADQRDDVLFGHVTVVQLAEEAGELLRPPDLGIVVFDLTGRELRHALDLDLVDHRVEDPLARAVARPAQHGHDHALLVLAGLVAEPDR